MRKKCRNEENKLEYILKITRCYLFLQPSVLMMYRYLEEFLKLKRRKSQLEAELCIEHHGNIENDFLIKCYYCGARFPSFGIVCTHILFLKQVLLPLKISIKSKLNYCFISSLFHLH